MIFGFETLVTSMGGRRKALTLVYWLKGLQALAANGSAALAARRRDFQR
jgi:hypothetical protein